MFNSYAAFNEMRIEEPEIFVGKKINELTELELISIRARFLRTLNIWMAAETAFTNNMISEAAYLITLADAKAKSSGIPVHQLFGKVKLEAIRMYGSGGCCDQKDHFIRELEMLEGLGINLYKIRAVKEDIRRTAWILEEAGQRGIEIGVDMCQNLTDPPQDVKEVVDYVKAVGSLTKKNIVFLEEAIGPANPDGFKALRDCVIPKICGGEIITTPKEMIDRINNNIFMHTYSVCHDLIPRE